MTAGFVIRTAVPDDAAGVVALRAVVYPYVVRGVESTRKMIAEPPPGEDWTGFVAEADGQVVGWASAYRNGRTSEDAFGEIAMLHVHPDHRRRGIGDALLAEALGHLDRIGARRIRTWALADSLPYARHHGFTPGRELRFSSLMLDPAPEFPAAPEGVRLLSLHDCDPHDVYVVDSTAAADEPEDVPQDAITYEQWRYDVWENVGLDRTASTAVEVDGHLVSISLVKRDGDRMFSDYTGTLPAYRGRGLARLAKLAALHRAAQGGVRVAYTSNDEENAPMLAINERLGYGPLAASWSCLREQS